MFRKIGVVGCGNMGQGIIEACLKAGYQVVFREINEDLVQKGRGAVDKFFSKSTEKGKITAEEKEKIMARVLGTTDLERLADCDLVIEVIVEDLEVKKKLFEGLDNICVPETIFVSNTSSLSISELSENIRRKDRFAGLHFFWPVAGLHFWPAFVNKLVEVVEVRETSLETISKLTDFSKSIGKIPIQVKDSPGFAVNRYFVPWLNEAVRILEESVADIPTIDLVAKETFGITVGPFELMNLTGLPIAYHAAKSLGEKLGDFYRPAHLLETRTDYGKKHIPWEIAKPEEEIDKTTLDAVRHRLLAAVFLTSVECRSDRAASLEDIDQGATVGLRWRQGPFSMMNGIGMKEVRNIVWGVVEKYDHFKKIDTSQWSSDFDIERWEIKNRYCVVQKKDQIAILTINRPKAFNALSSEVLADLKENLADLEKDNDVRVIIITGEGKAFVSGADIEVFQKLSSAELKEWTRAGQEVMNYIERIEKPVIAAINGFALGGGLELALACDILIASEKAKLGFPETNLGIFPGFGGTQRAARHIGLAKAKELIFTAEPVDAQAAERMGLVNKVVPAENLMVVTIEMAKKIASRAPIAVRLSKKAINASQEMGLEEGLRNETEVLTEIFKTEDFKEGPKAFFEKRKPNFRGK